MYFFAESNLNLPIQPSAPSALRLINLMQESSFAIRYTMPTAFFSRSSPAESSVPNLLRLSRYSAHIPTSRSGILFKTFSRYPKYWPPPPPLFFFTTRKLHQPDFNRAVMARRAECLDFIFILCFMFLFTVECKFFLDEIIQIM